MRKLWLGLALVVAVAAIAAGWIYYSFDAQRQRGIFTSRLEAALGRNVKLGGLKLSLFPPALSIRDAEIADALGFKNPVFSTAEVFQARVRLLPLLHGRVEVPSVELDRPIVHLVKNAQGEWNFASLGSTASAPAGPASPARPAPAGEVPRPLEIEELRLRDGLVTVDDLQKNTPRLTLDHIFLTVRNFAPNRAFDWEVAVHLPGPASSEVRAEGRGGPLARPNLAVSPGGGHVVFRDVALEALVPFTGQPGLAGQFDGEADFNSNGRKAEASGRYSVARLRLSAHGGTALAPLSGRFEVAMVEDASQLLIRQFDLSCGKATAHATGAIKLGSPSATEIEANITGAPLADIAKLFPLLDIRLPAGSSLSSGTLTARARTSGPNAALKRSGTINIHDARLAGYSLVGQMAPALRLMGVDAGGQDTAIESLEIAFDGDESYTRVPGASLLVPGMVIRGQGGFNQAGALDFRGTAVLTRASSPAGGLLREATGSANTVPFSVGGTLEHPAFRPDVGKIVNQQLNQQLQRQLGQPSAPTDQLLKGLGGLFNKKK